jgi:predicted nucleic acid-binding protein
VPCAFERSPQGLAVTHWAFVRIGTNPRAFERPLATDAVLASIAIDHGATLHTTDRAFARFDGLSWTNPLATPHSSLTIRAALAT